MTTNQIDHVLNLDHLFKPSFYQIISMTSNVKYKIDNLFVVSRQLLVIEMKLVAIGRELWTKRSDISNTQSHMKFHYSCAKLSQLFR